MRVISQKYQPAYSFFYLFEYLTISIERAANDEISVGSVQNNYMFTPN